jgi:hypothetical protein
MLGFECKGSLVFKVEDERPFHDLKGQAPKVNF